MSIALLVVTHNIKEVLLFKSNQLDSLNINEIVIVNTGVKVDVILGDRNVRIYDYKFNNNFPEVKNYGISKIRSNWILTIDTDELFDKNLLDKIQTLTKDTNIEGYWFRRKTFISKDKYLKYGLFYPDWQLRLFRNRIDYRYSGGVHALLPIENSKTMQVNGDILHYPSNPKYESFSNFKNLLPYIEMDTKEVLNLHRSSVFYLWVGWLKFLSIFTSGYFRGKGFLDGWAGFRAHILFALTIALPYFLAARKCLNN